MYIFRISSHIYNSSISLQLVSPFISSFCLLPGILTVHARPIFIPTSPILFTSVCFLPIFPYFRSSVDPAKQIVELDARNCFERGWRRTEFDRISYQAIYEKYASDLTFVSHFSSRTQIEQVSRLNMILNKFPCRYP